jgi:RNA-binding protein with serine-rich domain 1
MRSPSPGDDRPNGRRDYSRRRSRSRSPDRGRSRTRTRSRSRDSRYYRDRSYSRSPSRSLSPDAPQSTKIVIEKLTKNVNEGHLQEIFGSYGEIQDLEMPKNPQFFMNKGIAYILYTDAKHAKSAIAHMHEAQLDGAMINVSIVLPRRRFSRSPPPKKPPPNRFGEPHRYRDGPGARGPPPPDRAFGRGPPPRPSPGYGSSRRSPPRYGGRGGGYSDRYDDRFSYRPRSYSPSRSPPPRRRRSSSYESRYRSPTRSRSPPRRRRDHSPPRGGGQHRRSPSYSSYGSRSRSYSRDRGGRRR